jgi:hypothetical protein
MLAIAIFDVRTFRQQANISTNASTALLELIGDNWGQHGDIMFFMQGAYRTEEGKVMTFW